jgi:hypothetical protein
VYHAWGGGGGDKCIQAWSVILKGRDHSEDLGIDGRIVFRMNLKGIGW